VWCDETTAQAHFTSVAPFYDYIMGYFEIPANAEALRGRSSAAHASALDLGSGTGLSTLQLARTLPHAAICAVDLSAAMLLQAQRRLQRHHVARRVQLMQRDARHTGFGAASFDLVYSSFLLDLQAPEARAQILKEIHRILRPSGTAILAVMDGEPASRVDRLMTRLYNLGYRRWNGIWKLLFRGYAPHCRPIAPRAMMEDAGFAVVSRRRSHVCLFPVAIYAARKRP
jgi:ubiquinone/menaquinone biosynthesis C-methylase UbiE